MFLFLHIFILGRKSSNVDVLILSVFRSHTFKQCDLKGWCSVVFLNASLAIYHTSVAVT